MKPLLLAVLLLTVGVSAAHAASWTEARAASTVKAHYRTVDPKWAAVVQRNLDQAVAANDPPEHIAALRRALASARNNAIPTAVRCSAVGPARFHCVAHVEGKAPTPPDWKVYQADKRVTLAVVGAGYRITAGWS